MSPAVRRATPQDAGEISSIISEVLREGLPVALDGPMSPDEVIAWQERMGDRGAIFAIDDETRVLGFGIIDPLEDSPDECFYGAWIRSDERRKGYATLLAEEALAFARELGYRNIRGRLPEGNEPALSYLSAIGGMVPFTNPGAHFELPLEEE